jgi:hypothetical protein
MKPVIDFSRNYLSKDIAHTKYAACPKCGAKKGQLCRNLSPRGVLWQTWVPKPHRERKIHA